MRFGKSIIAAALLWGSFLLSHELAYRVAFPTAAERAHELAHSGHGWLANAIHFGVPALMTLLLLGLFIRGEAVSNKKLPLFGLGSAGIFVGVEILERYISSLTPGSHGFALNGTVMFVGAASAFIAGALVSGLYFTLRSFVVHNLSGVKVYVQAHPYKVSLPASSPFVALYSLFDVRITPMRGPPAVPVFSH